MNTGKSERHGSIPPPQYKAYRSHIGVLRMLGTNNAMIDAAFTVWPDSITLNLDVYLDILGYPEVVHIPKFVNEVK